jgi:hypothetical protein
MLMIQHASLSYIYQRVTPRDPRWPYSNKKRKRAKLIQIIDGEEEVDQFATNQHTGSSSNRKKKAASQHTIAQDVYAQAATNGT